MGHLVAIPTEDSGTEQVLNMIVDWLKEVEKDPPNLYGAMLVTVDPEGVIEIESANLDAFTVHTMASYIAYLQLQSIEESQH